MALRVTLPPVQNVVGPLTAIDGVKLPTGTLALDEALQPLAETLTLSEAGPGAGAVKVMLLVP